jgi:endonuclease YncB( thermonuclease family)
MVHRYLTILALLICIPFLLAFTGEVVRVMDGDTIEVLHHNKAERIRLHGIDCPEKGQAYGTRAKQATSSLVFGKDVAVRVHGKDKYGRTIAAIILPDGTNVNKVLVRNGWCWWYRKYAAGDIDLARAESEARKGKRGLWQDASPVPPWEFRKVKRMNFRASPG